MTPNIVRTDPLTIPPGEYRGTWSGYRITFEGHPFTIWTDIGIRGWAPVIVRVDAAGKITSSAAFGGDRSGSY